MCVQQKLIKSPINQAKEVSATIFLLESVDYLSGSFDYLLG